MLVVVYDEMFLVISMQLTDCFEPVSDKGMNSILLH